MAEYQIMAGDTLSKIAKRFGTTVKQLQELNGIKNANLIFTGKTLKLPDITQDTAFDNLQGWHVELSSGAQTKYGISCPKPPAEDFHINLDSIQLSDVQTKYGISCPKPPTGDSHINFDSIQSSGAQTRYGISCPKPPTQEK